ncbi:MAG: metalloregulator ArsR/SmtB family transcription factor [Proteobacteria bacterium]|nr:metalloregulator ArsR/SmtB family transcription factor [Pseudomonadota bacterium]
MLNRPFPKSRAETELDDFELVFSALSHEDRRRILVVLLGRGGQMTAGEIVQRFTSSWPTMTRHLHILEHAGLIVVEKRGRERHYILQAKRMSKVLQSWNQYFSEVENES